MIIFTDGSSYILSEKRAQISWAIRVEHDDYHTEQYGCITVNREDKDLHELLAFTHAAIYASTYKFSPDQIAVYTDDYLCSRAAFIDNCGGAILHPRLNDMLARLAKYVDAHMLTMVAEYLLKARVHKIKGHGNCVNNLRVDYLATVARKIHNGCNTTPWNFEQWLQNRATVSKWVPTFSSVLST